MLQKYSFVDCSHLRVIHLKCIIYIGYTQVVKGQIQTVAQFQGRPLPSLLASVIVHCWFKKDQSNTSSKYCNERYSLSVKDITMHRQFSRRVI